MNRGGVLAMFLSSFKASPRNYVNTCGGHHAMNREGVLAFGAAGRPEPDRARFYLSLIVNPSIWGRRPAGAGSGQVLLRI